MALIGNLHGEVLRINLEKPDHPEVLSTLQLGEDVAVMALTATPDLVAAGGPRGRLALFDSSGAALPDVQVGGQILSLDVSEDNTEILAGSSASNALLLGISGTSAQVARELPMKSGVHAVKHLGDRVVLGGSQGEAVVMDKTGQTIESSPVRSVITSIARGADGFLTGATTGLWPCGGRAGPAG